MSHTRWEELLGPLRDGELSEEEAHRVLEHTAGCTGCRDRLAQLDQLAQSLRSLPRERMPEDLKTTLLRSAATTTGGRAITRLHPWALASLASAALVLVVAVVATRQEAPPPPAAVPAEPQVATPPAGEAREEELIDRLRSLGYTATTGEADQSRGERSPASVSKGSRQKKMVEQQAAPTVAGNDAANDLSFPEAASDDTGTARPGSNVVARYTTEVIRTDDIARLGPIVDALAELRDAPTARTMSPQASIAEESAPTGVAPSAGAVAGGSAAAPPPGRDGPSLRRADATRWLAGRRGPAGHLTFLVSLSEDGGILSAQQIGAPTESAAVIDAVRALLVGSTVAPGTGLGAMTAVVDVRLPATP